MPPQLSEPLIERLLEAGALDVFLTPVIMKRSRPGIVLTALAEPSRVGELSTILFEESTTIGVRWTDYQRSRLERELVTLSTAYGPLSFKISRLGGKIVTVTPEFSEVTRIAKEKGLPVREVLDQARTDARRLLESSGSLLLALLGVSSFTLAMDSWMICVVSPAIQRRSTCQ